MRHDYELPPDWDALSTQEKSDWMTSERCRRQAKAQQRAGAMPNLGVIEAEIERLERRLAARQNHEYE